MKFTILFSLASLLILASARSADAAGESDELAIYKVLFSDQESVVLSRPDPKGKPTAGAPPDAKQDAEYSARLKKELPGVEDATIADYRHRALLAPRCSRPTRTLASSWYLLTRRLWTKSSETAKTPKQDGHAFASGFMHEV